MLYTSRINYVYNPTLNGVYDTTVALMVHDEYIVKMGGNPTPRFFEINRDPNQLDPIFHTPKTPYTQFSRVLDIPGIRKSARPKLVNTKMGQVFQQAADFWVSNLGLMRANYFPTMGDLVFWNGYRYEIINPIVPTESEWGQTGVWLGMVCESIVVPYGDARFPPDPANYTTLPVENVNGDQGTDVATGINGAGPSGLSAGPVPG